MRKRTAAAIACFWGLSILVTIKMSTIESITGGEQSLSRVPRHFLCVDCEKTAVGVTEQERALFDQIPVESGEGNLVALQAAFDFYTKHGATVNIAPAMLTNPSSGVRVRGTIATKDVAKGDPIVILQDRMVVTEQTARKSPIGDVFNKNAPAGLTWNSEAVMVRSRASHEFLSLTTSHCRGRRLSSCCG